MFKTFKRVSNTVVAAVLFSAFSFTGSPVSAEGLAYDGGHDLLVLPDCKLAVRYNNKTFVPVTVSKFSPENGYFMGDKPVQSIQIGEHYSDGMQSSAKGERILIECYEIGKMGRISRNRLNKEFTKNNKVKEINLTYDRIVKETGASKTGLHNLRAVEIFEVTPSDGSQKYRLFAFQNEKILTMYARRMRPDSKSFDDAAPVIVSQIAFQLEPDLKGNVDIEKIQ